MLSQSFKKPLKQKPTNYKKTKLPNPTKTNLTPVETVKP